MSTPTSSAAARCATVFGNGRPSGTISDYRPGLRLRRIFRPLVLGITAGELAPHLRVKPLPETGQIAGDLHRPAIRRQQMHHYRRRANARSFADPKEILEARFDPRRLACLVMNLDLAASRQT